MIVWGVEKSPVWDAFRWCFCTGIIYEVMGKNEREANSPSPTSNTLKVLMVYLTKLMETKGRLSLKTSTSSVSAGELKHPSLNILCEGTRVLSTFICCFEQVEKIQNSPKSVKQLSQWKDSKELKVSPVLKYECVRGPCSGKALSVDDCCCFLTMLLLFFQVGSVEEL